MDGDGMTNKERYDYFGKCCWTCKNKKCSLSQINKQPPHESSEGRNCNSYVMYID